MKEYTYKVIGTFILLVNIQTLVIENLWYLSKYHTCNTVQKQLQQVAAYNQEIAGVISCNHQQENSECYIYKYITACNN